MANVPSKYAQELQKQRPPPCIAEEWILF